VNELRGYLPLAGGGELLVPQQVGGPAKQLKAKKLSVTNCLIKKLSVPSNSFLCRPRLNNCAMFVFFWFILSYK
jgi:hypothetical protein